MSKKKRAFAAKYTDNLLHLSLSSPRSYAVESYRTAVYCVDYNAVVLFVRAFEAEELTERLIGEVTKILIHEDIHRTLHLTLTEEEQRSVRFTRGEEAAVKELETV